jgi:hypothetical protein
MNRIIYPTPEGGVAVIIPAESIELALKDVPKGVHYEIVNTDDIPADRTFRGAWVMGDCCIEHDIDQCKAIGHDTRRTKRAEEFHLFDEIIAKQIPGVSAVEAETSRQSIREKYALIQDAINVSETTDEIKLALEGV